MAEELKLRKEEEEIDEGDMGDAQGEYKLQFTLHEVKRENKRLCQELEAMKKDNTSYKVKDLIVYFTSLQLYSKRFFCKYIKVFEKKKGFDNLKK